MTAITNQTILSPWAAYSAGLADFVWTAGTATPGVAFISTGREVLLMRNDTGTNTVTITSVDNDKGRSENLAAYEITGADIAYWTGGLTNTKGWKQTDGTILITASSTDVSFAVLRLPAGY